MPELVGFQTTVILDPNGMTFDAVSAFGLAFQLLFKSGSSYCALYTWNSLFLLLIVTFQFHIESFFLFFKFECPTFHMGFFHFSNWNLQCVSRWIFFLLIQNISYGKSFFPLFLLEFSIFKLETFFFLKLEVFFPLFVLEFSIGAFYFHPFKIFVNFFSFFFKFLFRSLSIIRDSFRFCL